MKATVDKSFSLAQERYASLGVDVNHALKILAQIPISLHCWQGDDVGGFENAGSTLGNGLAVTGNFPGKARTPAELRADLEMALSLIPGKHRLNLHAFYGEFGGRKWTAMPSLRSILQTGSPGPERTALVSTSINVFLPSESCRGIHIVKRR